CSYYFVAAKEHENLKTPKAAFERHRLKGDKERAFSELLSDLDLHHPPCHSLVANNAYYLLGALAYNVLQALKVIYLPPEHQPKRIRTLLQHLLLIPVEIKRHARGLKAVFFAPAGWLAWWKGFLHDLLPRCRQVGPAAAGCNAARQRLQSALIKALKAEPCRDPAKIPPPRFLPAFLRSKSTRLA